MGPSVPFWVLSLDDPAVTAVRVRRTVDGALEVLAWWSVPVAAGEDPLAAALRAVRRRGLRDHGIQVVLPGRGAACRSCRLAPEDADLPPAELEKDFHDFTPFEPEEATLRARRLGGAGVLDFRVAAERRSEVERVERAFEEAGVAHLGVSLGPAALLTAVDALRLAPLRGYALEVHGTWSILTAWDGPLSTRHPVPFGIRDAAAALAAARGPAFDAAMDAAPGAPFAKALENALGPLVQDVRRAVEFHRAAVRGTGEEAFLLLGPGMERTGVRAALAAGAPAPFAPPPVLDPAGPLRPGPKVKPEALLAALPALLVPLGAAASAAGVAPRDLDFRNLPDELPEPRERTLFPAAAAVLVLGTAASWALAAGTRDRLATARRDWDALPPAPSPGALPPAEALALASEVEGAIDAALSRAAFSRALGHAVAAFPPASAPPSLPWGADRIEVVEEGGNYRARLRLRAAGTPARGALETERLSSIVGPLSSAGWRLLEARDGTAVLERLEMRSEGRR